MVSEPLTKPCIKKFGLKCWIAHTHTYKIGQSQRIWRDIKASQYCSQHVLYSCIWCTYKHYKLFNHLIPAHKCKEDYIVCIPFLSTIIETTSVSTNGWHTCVASHQYRPTVHHTDHQSVLESQHYYVGTLAWKGSHSCISWSSCIVQLWPCPRQHPANATNQAFWFHQKFQYLYLEFHHLPVGAFAG